MYDIHNLDGQEQPYEILVEYYPGTDNVPPEDILFRRVSFIPEIREVGLSLDVSEVWAVGEGHPIEISGEWRVPPNVGVRDIILLPDKGRNEVRLILEEGYDGPMRVMEEAHEAFEERKQWDDLSLAE